MGIAKVAINLAKRGLKPLINDVEKTITYTAQSGKQKKLLFGNNDKIKFWQTIDFETGQMKVYENLSNHANVRVSKLTNITNYTPTETKTITTNFDTSRQKVVTENHLTGKVKTQNNEPKIKPETGTQHSTTIHENTPLNIKLKPSSSATKQEKFEWEIDSAKEIVNKRMKKLDEVLLDENGNISTNCITINSKKYSFNDLIKPYEGNINEFYHATTPEAKTSIIMSGFNQRVAPKHGHLDALGGTYFSLRPLSNGMYGTSIIKAKFNGKIAQINPNLIEEIKLGNGFSIIKMLEKEGIPFESASELNEAVMREYLQQKAKSMGYSGVITTNSSWNADCNYFAALDPKLIQIIG